MRRTDSIDGLCRRMNSLIRNGKIAELAQEFVDHSCDIQLNGAAGGSGKSSVKKLGEALQEFAGNATFTLLHHTVSDDDHSYSEWKIVGDKKELHGVLICQWENNSVVTAKLYGGY